MITQGYLGSVKLTLNTMNCNEPVALQQKIHSLGSTGRESNTGFGAIYRKSLILDFINEMNFNRPTEQL